MLPLGFGRKQEFQRFTTDITNKEDLNNEQQEKFSYSCVVAAAICRRATIAFEAKSKHPISISDRVS